MIQRAVKKADRYLYYLSFAGQLVGAFALVSMTLVVAVSVAARNLFHVGLLDAITPTRAGMVLLVFMSSAWAMRQGSHVAVELFRERLRHPWPSWMRAIALVPALITIVVVIDQTMQFALRGLRLNEVIIGDINWPAFPLQAVIPIGLTLFALEVLRRIVLDVSTALSDLPREESVPEEHVEEP
jgi:TRAP-type C4-dicarboxylate transport system permease small subunit